MKAITRRISLKMVSSFAIVFLYFAVAQCTSLTTVGLDEAEAGKKLNDAEYYPLAVGCRWEMKTEFVSEKYKKLQKENKLPANSTITITGKSEIGKGMTMYFGNEGKEFLIQSKDGILAPNGVFILKYPIFEGQTWISGENAYDQRRFNIEKLGLAVKANGKPYANCIKVVVTSDFRATLSGPVAFESIHYYAPQVGPIVMEAYELTESGKRTLDYRRELVRFEKHVKKDTAAHAQDKPVIGPRASFRFPFKGFIYPILSPDARWLVYQKTESIWEELYYTPVGKESNKMVPVKPPGDERYNRFLGNGKWSKDGKFFAVPIENIDGKQIAIVDFGSDKPAFVESFQSEDRYFDWSSKGEIVYSVRIKRISHLMKKMPRHQAEEIAVSEAREIEFDIADDGTILFCKEGPGKTSYYVLNLQQSFPPAMVFSNPHTYAISLSPDSQYALFGVFHPNTEERSLQLLDLRTRKMIKELPAGKNDPLIEAKWSPDGTKLAYLEKVYPMDKGDRSADTARMNPHFFILDMATEKTQDFGVGVSNKFNWTPDSKHIIYSSKFMDPSLDIRKTGIYLIRISDGKEIAQLTRFDASHDIFVTPSLYYIAWDSSELDTFFVVKNPFKAQMMAD